MRGVLLEMLPLDEQRRDRHVVYAAYFVRCLTEPALAAVVRATSREPENLVAGPISRGQNLGEESPDHAVELIDRQLARIFTEA